MEKIHSLAPLNPEWKERAKLRLELRPNKQGLPRTGEVAPLPKPAAAKASEALLLVEDKEEVRAVLQSVFARNGYRTFLAGNGPEALKLWGEHQSEIALLFTDVLMPGGMNGRELAERLRIDRPFLKVVYCSGYDANILGAEALARPGTSFLAKPFNLAQAVSQVRGLLDQN